MQKHNPQIRYQILKFQKNKLPRAGSRWRRDGGVINDLSRPDAKSKSLKKKKIGNFGNKVEWKFYELLGFRM